MALVDVIDKETERELREAIKAVKATAEQLTRMLAEAEQVLVVVRLAVQRGERILEAVGKAGGQK